ncbi:MAG: FAD-binding protein [Thermodesulfobacteriota bacterium]
MDDVKIASWSNVLPTKTRVVTCNNDFLKHLGEIDRPFIPRGSGRSYGDAAYITNGVTLCSEGLRKILKFDEQRGTITCESGVQMVDLFNYLDPSEWSLAVAGGTQWVTIGGAVASDIHGKNDVIQGSFGNHIESMQVVTADGRQLDCSKTVNPELYAATIGGMGLTGFIKSVELRLQRPLSKVVQMRTKPFSDVKEMLECFYNIESDMQVAWIDLTNPVPRGIYYYASYVQGYADDLSKPIEMKFPTVRLFNRVSVRLLNAIRYAFQKDINKTTHIRNFHYPVDMLKHWNRLYGPRGFQEYQFAVPAQNMQTAYTEFIRGCRRFSLTPLFAVVKRFGNIAREGLLSFPKPGITFMADFDSRPKNQEFFAYFTDFLLELKGRIYLAKDSYMTKDQFERMDENIGQWREIVRRYDPDNRIKSDLSIRLNMKPW